MTDCLLGMVLCSSRAEARRLAEAVLTPKLAACVNIVAGVESHYCWRGKRECAREWLLLIKTTPARTAALTRAIRAAHSYEVPEIIFVPIARGDRTYLKWLRASVAAVAVWGLGLTVARADAVDTWIRQLGNTNEEIRVEAAERLAQTGGPRVEQQFREMLTATNPERRQMAVVGLLQVSEADKDLARVRERLKDEDATVRWSAALALGRSGRSEAIPWLGESAKNDTAESVREIAGEGMTRLQSGIQWLRSLPETLKQARALGKPVLAYFYVRSSEYCQQMEEGALADKEVVNAAQEFVCVRLDGATHADEARRFDVRGAPTLLVLDAGGNEMTRVAGLTDKAALLARLADARRGKLSFREARRAAGQNPRDVVANWKVAEIYLEDGREELAEPHLRNVIAFDEENRYGYTDDALLALGYALGKRGQHAASVVALEKLTERWPGFKDKDKALYCLGLSRLAIGQRDKARAVLEELVREFPDSPTVTGARKALEKLGEK